MPTRLIERTHSTPRFDLVADVNTKHRLIASVLAVKRTGTAVAFLVLAFLRDRRENFGRITCGEYVALYGCSGIDEHYHIFQNAPVYIANRSATFVALQRDPVAICFGHDTATTIRPCAHVGNDWEVMSQRHMFNLPHLFVLSP